MAGGTAVPSAGCGKVPSLHNGTNTITVRGTSRTYSLKIPANFNPTHPYPLVLFASPGLSPSDENTIYVSYDGTASETDLIDAIERSVEADMCVDTSRVQKL
jgi:hypothetical protein